MHSDVTTHLYHAWGYAQALAGDDAVVNKLFEYPHVVGGDGCEVCSGAHFALPLIHCVWYCLARRTFFVRYIGHAVCSVSPLRKAIFTFNGSLRPSSRNSQRARYSLFLALLCI